MTENQNAPSGWYPDGSGSTRWWNGAAWTEHVAPQQQSVPQQAASQQAAAQPQQQAPAQAPPGAQPYPGQPVQRTPIAPESAVDSAWTWVIALVPFITVPLIFTFDFRSYFISSMMNDMSVQLGFIAWQAVISGLSLIVTAFIVVAAWRDYRTLVSRGVVRPFHWAFSLLGALVYLIGRHVILRKVSRTPGWPLWVFLALEVVTLVVVSVWVSMFVQSMMDVIPYMGYSVG